MNCIFNCYITNCIFVLGVGYPSICKNFVILYNLESLKQGVSPPLLCGISCKRGGCRSV